MTALFEKRDYQEKAISNAINFFEKKDSKPAFEVLPTGSGKSVVIGSVTTEMHGSTLVLQPSKEILEQNYKKAQKFLRAKKGFDGDRDLGIYSASFGMKQIRKITFATIGSIKEKTDFFKNIDRVIMDECDLTNAKGGMYATLFEELNKPLLGVTASPYRLHPPTTYNNSVIKFLHRTRPRVYYSMIHVTQNKELFDRGYLCPIRYTRDEFDETWLSLNSTGAEFSEVSVRRYFQENDLTGRIVGYVKEMTSPHILIFVDYFEDAKRLHNRLASAGHDSVILTGETPQTERDKILNNFTSGQQRIVINMGVLTVGFDFPALSCIINARPTNSLRLYYQIIGRGIRINQEKQFCDYIDLGGNITRFGRVEDFEIVGPQGMERLKSGNRFLTGVDLKTGRDLEAERQQENAASDVIHFGKHKGQKISTLPGSYLSWIVENFSPGDLKEKALNEISRREQGGLREVCPT